MIYIIIFNIYFYKFTHTIFPIFFKFWHTPSTIPLYTDKSSPHRDNEVLKYGYSIGKAKEDIKVGQWVLLKLSNVLFSQPKPTTKTPAALG